MLSLEGANKLTRDLAAAICRQNVDDIRNVLKSGADPNVIMTHEAGRPTLFSAAIPLLDNSALLVMLEHGAKVNVSDDRGITPLMKVAMWNDGSDGCDKIRSLLRAGARADAKSVVGCTALDYAARRLRSALEVAIRTPKLRRGEYDTVMESERMLATLECESPSSDKAMRYTIDSLRRQVREAWGR